ncbi:hypothetical protein [Luteipulveratus halotolerans]|nr:hypothetical protein [Luteipulveratus halotolerans]
MLTAALVVLLLRWGPQQLVELSRVWGEWSAPQQATAVTYVLVVYVLLRSGRGVQRRVSWHLSAPSATALRAGSALASAAMPSAGGSLSLERRARHEAAHVVGFLASGVVVEEVDVRVRPDGSEGRVVAVDNKGLAPVEQAWGYLVGAVAGNVQDLRDGVHDGGSAVDMNTAQSQVWRVISCGVRPAGYDGPLTADALFEGARARAGEVLEQHRSAHEAVAARLVEYAESDSRVPLSGKDFDDLGVGRVPADV